MENIHATAKFGEIGIFISKKMSTNDVSHVLILISELKDLNRQQERERAAKIIEEMECEIFNGSGYDTIAPEEFDFVKQEALNKLNETL